MVRKRHPLLRSVNDTNNSTYSMASYSLPLSSNAPTAGSSVNPSTASASDFPQFPKLPVEIQLRIWGLCAPPATLLVVNSKYARLRRKRQRMNYYRRPVTTMLQVCKQSRQEYLHRDGVHKDHPTYRLCDKVLNGNKLWPVYISMEQDIVQIQHVSVLRQPQLAYLQNVLVNCRVANYVPSHRFYDGYFNFAQFVDLRRVICQNSRPHSGFQGRYIETWEDRIEKMILKRLAEANKIESFISILSADSQTFNLIYDYPIDLDFRATY